MVSERSPAAEPAWAAGRGRRVDVIVPAYRGRDELRRCLDSVRSAEQQTPFDLILIDDHSPEPEVSALLAEVAADSPAVTLLRNGQNLGFVGSVNRGMSVHGDRDVVLLNGVTVPMSGSA